MCGCVESSNTQNIDCVDDYSDDEDEVYELNNGIVLNIRVEPNIVWQLNDLVIQWLSID